MKKLIGLGLVLMLVSIGLLAGCTDSVIPVETEYTGVLKDVIFQDSLSITTVLFEDDVQLRFTRGAVSQLYLFCRNNKNETIYLHYEYQGNHHRILDYKVVD